jgi:hypothetical protein
MVRVHGDDDVPDCCDKYTKEGGLVLFGGGLRLSQIWRRLFELQAPFEGGGDKQLLSRRKKKYR